MKRPRVKLPTTWSPAQVRVTKSGKVQLKLNPKSMKLGRGGRFAKCVESVTSSGSAADPAAVCASEGRRKYGKRKFQKLAATGRKRAAARRRRPRR